MFRAVSLSFSPSALMRAKDKWRIMRSRREQCADYVGDWKGGGWRAEDRGDYSDGQRRNLRRRDERRETAKLNGCDPSRVWARLFRTREYVENFPDVCMNKFFSSPSARSKLSGRTVLSMHRDYWPPKVYQLSCSQLYHGNVFLIKSASNLFLGRRD